MDFELIHRLGGGGVYAGSLRSPAGAGSCIGYSIASLNGFGVCVSRMWETKFKIIILEKIKWKMMKVILIFVCGAIMLGFGVRIVSVIIC